PPRSPLFPYTTLFRSQTAPVPAELAGVPADVAARIRAAYAGGHFDGAHGAFAHVTDEMVDRFTVAGGAELWRRRFKDLVALGLRHLNVFVLSRDARGMLEALARDVLPAVRGSRDAAARVRPHPTRDARRAAEGRGGGAGRARRRLPRGRRARR